MNPAGREAHAHVAQDTLAVELHRDVIDDQRVVLA
jgi:hypothetical protein